MRSAVLLLLFVSSTLMAESSPSITMKNGEVIKHKNMMVLTKTNDQVLAKLKKNEDIYPTKVFRLSGAADTEGMDCSDVFDAATDLYNIADQENILIKFSVSCITNNDGIVKSIILFESFDALNEKGNKNIQEIDGTEFLGKNIEIETAEGVILTTRIESGTMITEGDIQAFNPEFVESSQRYYATSNPRNNRFPKLETLNSGNLDLIKSFYEQWFGDDVDEFMESLATNKLIRYEEKLLFLTEKTHKIYEFGFSPYVICIEKDC
jgi:hypothetical protein